MFAKKKKMHVPFLKIYFIANGYNWEKFIEVDWLMRRGEKSDGKF